MIRPLKPLLIRGDGKAFQLDIIFLIRIRILAVNAKIAGADMGSGQAEIGPAFPVDPLHHLAPFLRIEMGEHKSGGLGKRGADPVNRLFDDLRLNADNHPFGSAVPERHIFLGRHFVTTFRGQQDLRSGRQFGGLVFRSA